MARSSEKLVATASMQPPPDLDGLSFSWFLLAARQKEASWATTLYIVFFRSWHKIAPFVGKYGTAKRYEWGGKVSPGLPKSKTLPMANGSQRQYSTAGLPQHLELTMPALSPTMTMGNVVSWKKKEGDQVLPGDVMCEIETDKATLDNESQEEGFLAKILIPAGSREVKVGSVLAIMVESKEDVAKFANYAGSGKGAAAGAVTQATEQTKSEKAPSASGASSSLSPSSKMGPSVRKMLEELGLNLSQVVPTGPQGIVTKGDVIAAMEAGRGGKPAVAAKKETTVTAAQIKKAATQPKPEVPKPTPKPATSSSSSSSKPPVYKPVKLPPADPSTYEDIPVSQIRKVIATRLVQSKWSAPHLYIDTDVRLDSLMRWRKELKDRGIAISVNDIIIRASALALRQVPHANASWNEKMQEIKLNESVDVCVAVATDKGLITPIIRDADKKSLSAISAEVKDLAERARLGKLKPAEFQGGSFTISNLGMFAVDNFSAIINPPQACILAIGRGAKTVVWDESAGGEGKPAVVMNMSTRLSADHRVFDAGVAGEFLKAFKMNMEDPSGMLG
ncbi:hypothetical protein CBR_g28697 [Chara braunii]|uniref:Dihydrolipoamide acetyltransferase component of pyruvate dehydrogenase complex n=1 Tax=Chara braunii TaxID=69332 RepID=A0A388L9M4_CHABU|nr:hypothetical protein CBR_g28697 [Chara braunii]|eukprot:GBG78984.1 hypothetical protein CBR_g28697 [Chara braunii]